MLLRVIARGVADSDIRTRCGWHTGVSSKHFQPFVARLWTAATRQQCDIPPSFGAEALAIVRCSAVQHPPGTAGEADGAPRNGRIWRGIESGRVPLGAKRAALDRRLLSEFLVATGAITAEVGCRLPDG
jgi:hypothetical protein